MSRRDASPSARPELNRSLSLVQATLYGLGVTIGAGIYVLIGVAAAHSAMYAPVAFVIAALVMSLTAASFAELVGRAPVAAGEAAYAKLAFNSDRLATGLGLLVVAIAVISASAISVGAAGYIAVFVRLPEFLLVSAVVLAMGAIAAWGIKESVVFAGVMTLIEIAGLVLIIVAGVVSLPISLPIAESLPSLESGGTMGGLLSTTLLAVFAFIGFESLANVAEEVRDPARTNFFHSCDLHRPVHAGCLGCPGRGAAPELINSNAPLALVFERVTGASPRIMSVIAIVATLNGIVVQMIMSSRVLFGLGRQGQLPLAFGRINAITRTPLVATSLTVGSVLLFAVFLPLHDLADLTSRLTLLVFAVVNLSLAWIKLRGDPPPQNAYVTSAWVPWAGCASCLGLLVAELGVASRV